MEGNYNVLIHKFAGLHPYFSKRVVQRNGNSGAPKCLARLGNEGIKRASLSPVALGLAECVQMQLFHE